MISFFDLANEKDNEFYLSGKYSDDSSEKFDALAAKRAALAGDSCLFQIGFV